MYHLELYNYTISNKLKGNPRNFHIIRTVFDFIGEEEPSPHKIQLVQKRCNIYGSDISVETVRHKVLLK